MTGQNFSTQRRKDAKAQREFAFCVSATLRLCVKILRRFCKTVTIETLKQAMIQSMKTEFAPVPKNAEAGRTQRFAEKEMNRLLRVSLCPRRLCVKLPLVALLLCILALIPSASHAQTNNLAALLQQGLFEEQANRNLDAAIADYQALALQFDKGRQLAATAIFRLGECYRMQSKTNEAALEYQRILRDFSDQTTLATLSQQNLTGMGMTPAPAASAALQTQKDLLAKQIALAEQDFSDTKQRFQLGTAPQSEVNAAESRLLRLQQQLAALDSNRADLLDLSVSANSDEDQDIARIQTMIQNSPDLINAPSAGPNGNLTPLENAATKGWVKVAAFLLAHGADVNARGGTALFEATEAGNRAMVEFLLARGADVNAVNNGYKRTPLETAVQHGFEAVAKVLLDNKADVNVRDSLGDTPLFIAAQFGQTNIVQMFLKAGAHVNVENNEGRTPLSFAAGHPETVKMLLDAKADPNGGKLDAPLLCAIDKNDTASAELLLQAGAKPNAEGKVDWQPHSSNYHYEGSQGRGWATPLWLAVDMDQVPMVQLLLKFKTDPNDSQTDGRPLLFSALSDTNILEALLDAGAKVDARDDAVENQRGTPLEYAARSSDAAAAEILLNHGADPNFRDFNDATPLHYAMRNNVPSRAILEFLLNHRANPNVRDRSGKTPLDYLKQLLAENGVRPDYRTMAEQLPDLLRQHGALDVLPDWDRITVSRPSANFSQAVFQKATNDWNQFTLLETICGFDQNDNRSNNPLAFADLSHIVVVRPSTNGATAKRIEVNLLHATNGVDCSKDIPLEFGDTVEIPEREHTLAEPPIYLPKDQFMVIFNYLRNKAGEAKLIVKGGETVSLPLQEFYSQIGNVLLGKPAQTVLTSSSDLARVKVIRPGLKTGMANQWILDCSHLSRTTTGGLFAPNGGAPDLILRDGDVIEVPEKP